MDELEGGRKLTRQGPRTRRSLLRAARRVFEKRGYHETRIADITTAAKTAVGSFYTYFDSKEEIFRELLIEIENEVYQEPGRLPKDAAPIDRIRETNRLYFEAFNRNAAFWAVLDAAGMTNTEARELITGRHSQSRARAERAFRSWQANGVIPEAVDIEFAAMALGAMTERCAYIWFVFKQPMDLDHAVEEITQLWLRALQIDPGVASRSLVFSKRG